MLEVRRGAAHDTSDLCDTFMCVRRLKCEKVIPDVDPTSHWWTSATPPVEHLSMSAPTNPLSSSPSRPGLRSPCGLTPSWAPASRDPRFSRRTPDGFLARIEAKKPSRVIGGRHERVGNITHGTARSRPLFSARRGEAVAVLKKIAERLEAAAAGDVQTSSSASLAIVVREMGHQSQETQKLRARHRAVMIEGPYDHRRSDTCI